MEKLFKMFLSFLKIGAFTFGGGYAMIPLIEEEVVNNNKWISKEDFMDILVVAQSLPGALAVNCSTMIGYKIGGIIGGLIGLLGVVMPSFIIILIVAAFFVSIRENYYVDKMFKGINSAVPILILAGVISISKGVKKSYMNIIIFLVALVLLAIFEINPVFVIIGAAIYGGIFLREKVE
ncbi:MAG: chromate transporter [Clostridium sp.]